MISDVVALLIKDQFPPPLVGGARTYYHELLRRQRRGRFVVLTSFEGEEDPAFERAQPYRIERRRYMRPERSAGYAGLLALHTRLLADVLRILPRDHGLLLLGQTHLTALVGLIAERFAAVPYVMFLHGEELAQLRQKRTLASYAERTWTRHALRRASAIIAANGFARDQGLAFGAPAEGVHVIHPGVDCERFRPDLTKKGPAPAPRLLTVGRLYRRKGIDMAIGALAVLRERFSGITLQVAGEGPDRPRLESLAREQGVADRVRFHGRVSADQLPELYRQADVFVLPNRTLPNADTEGFGMVFLEAAASGVPAVGGRAGGTSESVVDGETGLLVDSTSAASVADAVERLLTDARLWTAIANRGRERAREEFSWDRSAERFAAVLDSIGPHPGRP